MLSFYIVSVAKIVSKKIGALVRSIKFLSPEVALYLYESTIQTRMEYCCHAGTGAPISYLDMLDKLEKWVFKTVGPTLAASLELLGHRRNIASLNLFDRCYFSKCSSKLAEFFPFPYSPGRFIRYSNTLHDSLSPFIDVIRMFMSIVSFLARL